MSQNFVTRAWNHYSGYSRNVLIIFAASTFNSIGFGMIFQSAIYSIFVKTIGESNFLLGAVMTISGLSSTIIIFPSGILADRWRRDGLIRVGAIFSVVGGILLALATSIEALLIAGVFFGLNQGFTGPALRALIADSTETGTRSRVYSELFFIQSGLSSVGPFASVLFFLILGDVWAIEILRAVIGFGVIITIVGACIQVFVNDKYSLGKESEIQSTNETDNSVSQSSFGIPLVLVVSGILIGFGAGMTVMFFPIFFKEEYSLQPVFVNLIFGFASFLTGTSGLIAQKISKILGRIETMVLTQMIAIACLLIIAFYPPLIVLVPAYIFRQAFMNASSPLSQSIVMDKIAKRHRGIWSSLEHIAWGLFWSVSAGIGGLIIDNFNFVTCFMITATLYTIATVPLIFIRTYVEKEKSENGIIS